MTKTAATLLITISLYAFSNLLPNTSFAQTQPPTETNAPRNYIAGIEALNHTDYPRAIQSLTRAITADPDNPSYRRARGVAFTLNESFPDAIADLDRAQHLDPNDTEARLWLAAAYRMSNDPAKGASLFTMRNLPHDYANLVYNLMAMQYWQTRNGGQYLDPATHRTIATTSPIKTLFPQAAKTYAQRNRATGPEATQIITEQTKAAIDRADWPLAIQNLIQLRTDAPDDPTLRQYWALALIGADDAPAAREEFTRALSVTPLWPAGYLGRAQAHALLGDDPRAQADLQVAASLGLGNIQSLRQQLTKFSQSPASPDALQQFNSALQSNAPFLTLVDAALSLLHLTNSQRARYDESYQFRIRLLSEALHDHPKNADHSESLARFLFNNSQVPLLWDGPRSPGKPLRPQSPADYTNEINRALELCDTSLNLDPQNPNVYATKAGILYALKAAVATIESLTDRGLAIDPDNTRLLDLKSRILLNHAADCAAQAAGLRAGHDDFRTENRPDGIYRIRTHYPPTAEQLAQAAQLDAEADQYRRQAEPLRSHLLHVTTNLIPNLLQQNTQKSLAAAYLHNPNLPETLLHLADLAAKNGDTPQAQIDTLLATPMQETTAANELKTAWEAILHTQWKAAEQSLKSAATIDPADPRVPACRSIVESQRDTPDLLAAHRSRLAALALEEALARLSGTTRDSTAAKIPTSDLLDVQQSVLALTLRINAGNADLASQQTTDALADFSANIALEKRLDPGALTQLLPSAMLPDPADPNALPPTLAELLAASRLGLAKTYLTLHQPENARAQYAAIHAYLANWPATAPNRESLNTVDSWARLGEAESEFQARHFDAALTLLEHDGWPGNLPPELDTRRKQLADQLHQNRNTAEWQQVQQQINQYPTQARITSLQDEITSIQKQRDSLATDLADPNTSARQKQVEQSSLDELDTLLTQKKSQLQKLQPPNP